MLESLREKLLMLKLKEIIVNQIQNQDYYENAANIYDKITVIDEKLEIDGEKIRHEKVLYRYLNGFMKEEECYYQIKPLPVFGVEINRFNKEYIKSKAKKIS